MSSKLKILVTGANGQLGNELNNHAINDENNYYFTDIDQLNLLDFDALSDKIIEVQPDIIINCAAYTAVDMAENDQEMAMAINVTAVKNIGELAKKYNIKVVQVSTDYVYDGRSFLPYSEEDATNPISVYGYTKLLGEKELIASGCDAIIIRTSWLYSIYGNNFLKTITKLAQSRDEISIVFDQIGTPTYAGDLAKAIISIIPQLKTIGGVEVYHFSNEGVCSWYDFAIEIVALLNLNTKIYPIHSEEYPTTAQRPFYSVLDKSKIKNSFGLEIKHWREGLITCIDQLNQK